MAVVACTNPPVTCKSATATPGEELKPVIEVPGETPTLPTIVLALARMRTALRRFAAWSVAGALGLPAGSILIDGLGRKLTPLGMDLPDRIDSLAGAGEEIMEAFIPFLLLTAIIAAARSRNRQAHP